MNMRYFRIRDEITKGEITLNHIPSNIMEADLLTKSLSPINFIRLRNLLMNIEN